MHWHPTGNPMTQDAQHLKTLPISPLQVVIHLHLHLQLRLLLLFLLLYLLLLYTPLVRTRWLFRPLRPIKGRTATTQRNGDASTTLKSAEHEVGWYGCAQHTMGGDMRAESCHKAKCGNYGRGILSRNKTYICAGAISESTRQQAGAHSRCGTKQHQHHSAQMVLTY